MATCRGIDVSAYQGTQDWNAWKKQGLVFAFAKASEGQHSRDGQFAAHITGIKAAGIVPGAYHFGWPNQDPKAEAKNYIGAVKVYAGKGFTHWLDLERYPDGRNYRGRSDTQIREWVTTWLAAVRTAFPGQRVGVYTSGDDLARGHVPAGTTLWYPAYPGAAVDMFAEAEARARPRPSGWAPLIWQFTSDPAGPARIDESIAYLSAADFRAWAGTAPAPAAKPKYQPYPGAAWFKKHPHSPIVTAMGKRLVAVGCSAYAKGPGPQWTEADRRSYAKWQHKLGYRGADADGWPGAKSWAALKVPHV